VRHKDCNSVTYVWVWDALTKICKNKHDVFILINTHKSPVQFNFCEGHQKAQKLSLCKAVVNALVMSV
jgi:hypothetical protein